MTPEGELSGLIEDVFRDGDDLRVFVADHFTFQAAINWNQSLVLLAQDVARHLLTQAEADPFLDQLAENNPGQADRIREVQESVRAGAGPATTPSGINSLMGGAGTRAVGPAGQPEAELDPYQTVEFVFSTVDDGFTVAPPSLDDDQPRSFDLEPLGPGTLHVPGTARETAGGDADRPTLDPEELTQVGRNLWEVVFSDDGLGLADDLPPIDPQSGGRRLVVDLSRSPELAPYPWEYLEDPGRTPFGADVKSTVVRKVDQGRFIPARLGIDQPPLRLLIATAQSVPGEIDIGAELHGIEAAGLTVQALVEQATYRDLFRALRQHRPDVLHFIGHGTSDGIELQADDTGARLLSGADLAGLVGNQLENLRLVFLNSCLGANEPDPHAFTGAASQMVSAGLPAAIAMQYPISDTAAVELAELFYEEVAAGADIDVALTHARSYLKGQPRPEWGAPTLYVRDWTGRLALVGTDIGATPRADEPEPQAGADRSAGPLRTLSVDQPAATVDASPASPASTPIRTPSPATPSGPVPAEPVPLPTEMVTTSHVGIPVGRRLLPAAALILLLGAIALFIGRDGVWPSIGAGDSDETAGPSASTDIDGSEEPDDDDRAEESASTSTTRSTTTTTQPTTTTTTVTTTPTTGGDDSETSPTTRPTPTTEPEVVVQPADPVTIDDGDVAVANGSGQAVDVYVDGELAAASVAAAAAGALPAIEPGDHRIDVHAAADAPAAAVDERDDDPVASTTVTVGDLDRNEATSVILEPMAGSSGELTVRLAADETSPTSSDRGRVVVRDLTDGGLGPVELLVAGQSIEASPVDGPITFEAPTGPATLVVRPTGAPAISIPLTIDEGAASFVSLVTGSDPGSVAALVHVRTGLTRHPDLVPTGNSGLRSVMTRRPLPAASPRWSPTSTVTGPAVATAGTPPRPVTITAEAIGLGAVVAPVGIAADDRMEVPSAETVGWYRHGSTPGRAGSTVLAAHVDWNGREGAFFHLADLQPGDRIEVALSDGSTVTHVVVARADHPRDALPVDQLYRPAGDPVLHLITCGGAFDHRSGHYEDNVVVTAVPVAEGH